MILSVHIPKTAGSSFKDLLVRKVGAQRVCLRYDQTPLRYRADGRPVPSLDLAETSECTVVHGHFVADHVILPPGVEAPRCAVWLRHPVERLISHYLFWKRQPYLDQPLCRRLLQDDLGVEEFASLPAMRNLQSFFLGAIPISRFAFVGVTELFAESIDRFNATFGVELDSGLTVNANPDKPARDYRAMVGDRVYASIAALNAADMALYARARVSYD